MPDTRLFAALSLGLLAACAPEVEDPGATIFVRLSDADGSVGTALIRGTDTVSCQFQRPGAPALQTAAGVEGLFLAIEDFVEANGTPQPAPDSGDMVFLNSEDGFLLVPEARLRSASPEGGSLADDLARRINQAIAPQTCFPGR